LAVLAEPRLGIIIIILLSL